MKYRIISRELVDDIDVLKGNQFKKIANELSDIKYGEWKEEKKKK